MRNQKPPPKCDVCQAPYFRADPRWKFHPILREWRHVCILSPGPGPHVHVQVPPAQKQLQLVINSREDAVTIDTGGPMVNQIALPPTAALIVARALIQHAGRAGGWEDALSDFPNLVRVMRAMQKSVEAERSKQSANAIPALPPTGLKPTEMAVDAWLEHFDDDHRPALPRIEEEAPAGGMPS